MKIIVITKQDMTFSDGFEIRQDGLGIKRNYLGFRLNESYENALEEALLLKDKFRSDCELIVIGIGGDSQNKELQNCLGKGADRAIQIDYGRVEELDSHAFASILSPIIQEEEPDLVLTGALTGENDSEYLGAFLANKISWPYVNFISNIKSQKNPGEFVVERELENGAIEKIPLNRPAVLTIQAGSNSPRYVSLRKMKGISKEDVEYLVIKNINPEQNYLKRMDESKLIKVYVPKKKQVQYIDGEVVENVEWLTNRILECSREKHG